MGMYLRRSSLRSPTEKGQAPSKAAVLSEAHSPVSSADPSVNPPPRVSAQLQPLYTPVCSGAKRSRT